MKRFQTILPALAVFAISSAVPATAQTTTETKVTRDSDMKDGVATDKMKVVSVQKHKTRHAKRILGVKVGHKTAVHKTEKTTSQSSNGDMSTKVKTTNK